MNNLLQYLAFAILLFIAVGSIQAQTAEIQRAGDTFYKFLPDGAIHRSDDMQKTWKQILAPVHQASTTMEVVTASNELSVVPNPSTGSVTIKGEVLHSFPDRVSLVHLDGRIEEIPMAHMAWSYGSVFLDLSTYSGGVYTVVMTVGEHSYSTKVLRK
jgi:hypothetical protein